MGAPLVRWAVAAVLTGFALAGAAGCGGPPPGGGAGREVRVAAAADLKFALDEAASEFQAKNPGIAVTVTYGSSGTLFAQLTNDAPFDLFLSADIDYPRKLAGQGKAVQDSEFTYAVGHLVVWVPNGSKLDLDKLGIRAVADPSVKKVAIANPKTAPYGRAAEAAVKSLGVYDQVKDRLVVGENIAQAAQFVESGAADVGLIALSLALAPNMKDKGRYWPVPLDAYPRLEQGGVILTGAKDADAARALRAFLTGAEGRAILKRYGFTLPGE
jgi:molybdate transport system substrate-binding protein